MFMKLNKKRGVSDVVTTVLMILLVIAAIGILWVVIQKFVTSGVASVPTQADCLTLQLTLSNAKFSGSVMPANTLTVSVTRGGTSSATVNTGDLKFFVDGSSVTLTAPANPGIGETKVFSGIIAPSAPTIVPGTSKISVAAKIGDSTCSPSEPVTIVGP